MGLGARQLTWVCFSKLKYSSACYSSSVSIGFHLYYWVSSYMCHKVVRTGSERKLSGLCLAWNSHLITDVAGVIGAFKTQVL